MYYYYYIFLFVILGLIIYIIYVFTNKKTICNFTAQNISFLTKDESALLLSQDKDGYISNMSTIDLYARKVKTFSEYIQKIMPSTKNFNQAQITKLERCAKKADEFLKNHNYENQLDCNQIAKIPWKFALTDKEYEEGLSHTRDDVIFLSQYTINDTIANDSNDDHLTGTLIHEKVHIFQRFNTNIMANLIKQLGYKEVQFSNYLKRCNPDINDKVYMNADGVIMVITYKSDMPSGINDIKSNSYTMEHPYEKIAYDIANEYTKRSLQDIMKIL